MPGKHVTNMPGDVVEAAQKIWFAGLGAMALAQQEGGKLVAESNKLFHTLVEKGEEMESHGQSPVSRVKEAAGGAEQAWLNVQAMIDAQITAVLHRLGVPTKDEIAKLGKRVEQLTHSIEALKAKG